MEMMSNIKNSLYDHEEVQNRSFSSPIYIRPLQSQSWLRSCTSEFDNKIKMMLELIEDDGDTFAKRAEMYYEKRPQLIKMVQEIQSSYRALADKYDYQLKSTPEGSIKTKVSENISGGTKFRTNAPVLMYDHSAGFTDQEEYSIVSNNSESVSSSFHDQTGSPYRVRVIEKSTIVEDIEEEGVEDIKLVDKLETTSEEQMKFAKLLEENLLAQAELMRRNEEKRGIINSLTNENKFLKSASKKVKNSSKERVKKNQLSKGKRLKGLFCFA